MREPRRRRRVPWQLWYVLSALGFGLALLAQLGKEWGWWNDWEAVLSVAGLLLGILTAVTGASDRTVTRLEVPLERIADDMATVRVVLERLERLLTERLPPIR